MSVPSGPLSPGPATFAAVQATFAATLVDEWIRGGVTDAVVAPGSRSTPLALALAGRPELRLHVRLDERSAGFYALGLALASGQPSVICVTSGTAAAELHPAVVEAHHAGVPVIVCTADRPPELQAVGAPQTIDQSDLFGPAVRWALAPGVAEAGQRSTWRSIGSRALAECRDGPRGPGPVHLNLAFRDPLVGPAGPLPDGRPGGRPWHQVGPVAPGVDAEPTVAGWVGRPGVIVAGGGAGPADDVLGLARRLGWPVLADPRSGCRVARSGVVGAAESVLRVPEVRRALRPEVVLMLGQPWAGRAVASLVEEAAGHGAEVVALDPAWRWADPDRVVARIERADPGAWLRSARSAVPDDGPVASRGWLKRWVTAETAAQLALGGVLEAEAAERGGRLSEPGVARNLLGMVGPETVVVTASSMPVRDLEWFSAPLDRPPRVVANRGANGIDGVTSTARGVAAATGARPVVALLGDLAFLHDVSGLVEGTESPPGRCTLVVLDNGGGGIFSFLPQAGALDRERFEALFATPPSTSVAAVATGFGRPVAEVLTEAELGAALVESVDRPGLSVVRVAVPDRPANVALHQRLHQAVAGAVGRLDLT